MKSFPNKKSIANVSASEHIMDRITIQSKICFISTILWGIISHGMAMFNKYSYHDDIAALFGIGTTIPSGRWMLDMLAQMYRGFFGSTLYSIPLFNVLFSLIFLSVINCFLVRLFEIKKALSCIGLTGIMVSIPVITGMFSFMFTAPAYLLGLMIGVIGTYMICRGRKWPFCLAGIVLICCCIGVYQAHIPVIISIFLIYMIKSYLEREEFTLSGTVREAAYYIAVCAAFMVLYFLINKWVLAHTNTSLTDYQGINTMGITSVKGYIYRFLVCYKEFFMPGDTAANIYPMRICFLYRISLALAVMVFCCLLCCRKKVPVWNKMYASLLALLLPFTTNFIYFMCDSEIHTLMVYGKAMYFVFIIWLFEQMEPFKTEQVKKVISVCARVLILIICIQYCRFDNICYLKAEFEQQQEIEYFTTLITRIKSTEGYTDEFPVAFIGDLEKSDRSFSPIMEEIKIYAYSTYVNSYAWKDFMRRWCGYSPVFWEDMESLVERDEVKEMTSYPDDGSIKVVDGIVVVKFSENGEEE